MVYLSALEIIAAIFAIIGIIKLIVIVKNKKAWLDNIAKPIYKQSQTSSVIFIILAIIIFYFLMQELSIVQIFAAMAFTSVLIGLGLMSMSKEFAPFVKKIYTQKKKFSSWTWIYALIWLILSLCVLKEIFLI